MNKKQVLKAWVKFTTSYLKMECLTLIELAISNVKILKVLKTKDEKELKKIVGKIIEDFISVGKREADAPYDQLEEMMDFTFNVESVQEEVDELLKEFLKEIPIAKLPKA